MTSDLKYERANIELRRSRVLDLIAQGVPQYQVAQQLNVSASCVSLDIQYLEETAKENIEKQLQEVLPIQHLKVMSGLHQVLRKTWEIVNKEHIDDKTKLQSLALVNESYRLIMELSSDGNVIKEAMAFVRRHNNKPTTEEENKVIESVQNQEESEDNDSDKEEQEEEEEEEEARS